MAGRVVRACDSGLRREANVLRWFAVLGHELVMEALRCVAGPPGAAPAGDGAVDGLHRDYQVISVVYSLAHAARLHVALVLLGRYRLAAGGASSRWSRARWCARATVRSGRWRRTTWGSPPAEPHVVASSREGIPDAAFRQRTRLRGAWATLPALVSASARPPLPAQRAARPSPRLQAGHRATPHHRTSPPARARCRHRRRSRPAPS